MHRAAAVILSGVLLALSLSMTSPSQAAVFLGWSRYYSSPGNGIDQSLFLSLDLSGNVHIAGTSNRAGTFQDLFVVKYDPLGQRQWAKRYNGPGNAEDLCAGLTLDAQGNVFVTGSSVGKGTGYDIVTIMYDANGKHLWTKRYNGPGDKNDYARAIRVDAQGRVYVAGQSFGSNITGYDIATVVYNPDGTIAWKKGFNGPVNGNDEPKALALDQDGNVYVAGKTQGPGTGDDGIIIKYNQNGRKLWDFTYNDLANGDDLIADLAVGPDNNIYVTGSSWGNESMDFFTARVNPDGSLEWINHYDGPGKRDDWGKAIVVTPEGRILVLGNSKKEDAWGPIVQEFDGVGSRYFVNGPGSRPVTGNALAVDNEGNAYVAGKSQTESVGSNFYLSKIDTEGKTEWTKSLNGSANGNDEAAAVAADNQGNVYATGSVNRTGTGVDGLTVKYKQTP